MAALGQGPRLAADADEEDAALSAFHCLCEGAVRGRFLRLDDRDDLWRVLAMKLSCTEGSTLSGAQLRNQVMVPDGESADAETLFREFGMTTEAVVAAAKESIAAQ